MSTAKSQYVYVNRCVPTVNGQEQVIGGLGGLISSQVETASAEQKTRAQATGVLV